MNISRENNYYKSSRFRGYTLIEAMVATAIASIMSLSVVSVYINQSGNISTETQRDTSIQEANRAFDVISRLLRQAQQNTVFVDYGTGQLNGQNAPEVSNDSITVTFALPNGFNIWPNNNGAQPIVQLSWQNTGDNGNVIQIDNAATAAGLGTPQTFAGDNTGNEARIINLDIWPMLNVNTPQPTDASVAQSGYLLRVTTRAAQPDLSYTNPDDNSNFRTHTVSGIVWPRN